MATISPTPKLQFLDANGNPLSYGLLYTYIAGTTSALPTYTTAAQTTANTNPIVLDSRGQADVWLLAGFGYKFTLQNSSGVLQYTVDNITAAGTMSTQNADAVVITGGTISGVTITGPITGDVTGNLTGNVTGNVTGSISGGTVSGSSYNGGQLAGMRNIVVNGDMSVSQRATSWASVGSVSNTLYIDRWSYYNDTNGVVTISQSSSVPLNTPFSYAMSVSVTTADTSVAGQAAWIRQVLYNATNSLLDKTFTISFWVKSSLPGVYSAVLRAFLPLSLNYKTLIKNFTVNVADVWEYKTLTVINGTDIQNSEFELLFVLAAGAGYNGGTANVWATTSSNIATSSQANFFNTFGNVFAITGVQIELGSVATPFEFLTLGVNQYLCQKDYQQIGTPGTEDFRYAFYANSAVNPFSFPVIWPVTMNSTPNVTITGSWTTSNVTAWSAANATLRGCSLSITATGAGHTIVSNGATNGFLAVATGR